MSSIEVKAFCENQDYFLSKLINIFSLLIKEIYTFDVKNNFNQMEDVKALSTQIRRDIIRMVHGAASGHPGGSLGCADFFAVLYSKILKHNPKAFNMEGKGEDVFLLSNGHISPVWYSTLARTGYFDIKELGTFRKINSRLQGHPTPAEHLPGIRLASGSLGQGLSAAIGIAQVKNLNKDDNLVYVLMGDGELQEGQIWEAAMYAGSKKVDNLIAVVDYNKKQIDGSTDDVLPLGDLAAKWHAFGWEVMEMNGHNHQEIYDTLMQAKQHTKKGKAIVILMHSEMGYGVDFMMGTHKWHGNAPNDEQAEKALAQLSETLGDY
jgi:transketolase